MSQKVGTPQLPEIFGDFVNSQDLLRPAEIWQDLSRFAKICQDLLLYWARFAKICQDLTKPAQICCYLVEFCQDLVENYRDLPRSAKLCWDLMKFGGIYQDLSGSDEIWLIFGWVLQKLSKSAAIKSQVGVKPRWDLMWNSLTAVLLLQWPNNGVIEVI